MAYIHIDCFSETLGMGTQLNVVLPERAEWKKGKKIPVIYLLHDMSENPSSWLWNTSIKRYAEQRNIAVVMPDADLSLYTDMYYGYPYYTFLVEELPIIVRKFFPGISDRREDTLIAGNGAGGYGAFKIALRNPEIYGSAASLSGLLDIVKYVADSKTHIRDTFWSDIFGNVDDLESSMENLFSVVDNKLNNKQLLPRLFISCSTTDQFSEYSLQMACFLKDKDIEVTYVTEESMHGWKFLDGQIQKVLDWFMGKTKEL